MAKSQRFLWWSLNTHKSFVANSCHTFTCLPSYLNNPLSTQHFEDKGTLYMLYKYICCNCCCFFYFFTYFYSLFLPSSVYIYHFIATYPTVKGKSWLKRCEKMSKTFSLYIYPSVKMESHIVCFQDLVYTYGYSHCENYFKEIFCGIKR